jgi:hypothetical protein
MNGAREAVLGPTISVPSRPRDSLLPQLYPAPPPTPASCPMCHSVLLGDTLVLGDCEGRALVSPLTGSESVAYHPIPLQSREIGKKIPQGL